MSHPNHGDMLAVWGATGAFRSKKQEKMQITTAKNI